jgi:hypothetical protein
MSAAAGRPTHRASLAPTGAPGMPMAPGTGHRVASLDPTPTLS